MQADVKEIFELPNAITQLFTLQSETTSACQEARNEAEQLLEETRQEEQNSLRLLNVAREVEETTQAAMTFAEGVMLAAETRLAAALAEETAAIASANPVAIAAASAEVFSAQQAYQQARKAYEMVRQAYEAAKAHRELLERRYEMAKQAVNFAEAMKSKLEMNCMRCLAQIAPLVEQGVSRITQAYEDLQRYHAKNTSVANLSDEKVSRHVSTPTTPMPKTSANCSAFKRWENYQPTPDAVIKPQEINERLNPSAEVLQGLLESRYQSDPKFRAKVDSYREQAKKNRADVETKIKRNMVGGFAEEIVKHALKPYGGVYRTQERVDLPDGSYTKPDFILHGLKNPMIVGKGKGKGMGVRENGSIGIEVKTGQPSYILEQREHLEKQAQGHVQCYASWTICTRDVREIEVGKQQELRSAIREAGSPIIGVLPYKSELDAACMNFVFGDTNHD